MIIELRVAISPTSSFLNQVLLLTASLRRFHPGSIVRAYIGDANGSTPKTEQMVEEAFDGHRIGFEWIGGKEFTRWESGRAPFLGQMNRRWSLPVHGDTVVIADADILFTGTLDDVLCRDAVQGVQAHVPPLTNEQFRYLFRICDTTEPRFDIPYTGAGFMAAPDAIGCPYPNSGMVVLPKACFEAMIPHYHMAINQMRSAMRDHYWFDQLGLAVALAKAQVPYLPLTMRYNFPNQVEFEERYPEELRDARVIHYLRENRINRISDFESLPALRRLVARDDLRGSNEILRRAISANMGILEPAPLSRAEDAPWA